MNSASIEGKKTSYLVVNRLFKNTTG